MSLWLKPTFFSGSSSSSFSSSSSEISQTSTIEYGHETFRTFEKKVVDLACRIPQLGIISASAVTATRMAGGYNYRIIGITVDNSTNNTAKNKPKAKTGGRGKTKYILRIPRREKNNNTHLAREVAVLYFLHMNSAVPVPGTVAFDLDGLDGCPIERPYVLQTHAAGVPLDQAFGQMSFAEKKRLVSNIVDLYASMDRVRFERAGALGPSSGGISNRVVDVVSFDLGPESDENHRYRTYPQETTLDMLLSQFECWKFVAGKEDEPSPEAKLVFGYLEKFIDITVYMGEKGWLGDNKNTVFHPDLSPRHIFVIRTGPSSKVDWQVSGVIDWDGALSVPRVMANRAPSWLWRWGSADGYDAFEEKGDGNNPEDKDCEALKHHFEVEVSQSLPRFLEHAYKPRFQLLRKLCRFAIWGLRWEEDIKRANEFLREWGNLMADTAKK